MSNEIWNGDDAGNSFEAGDNWISNNAPATKSDKATIADTADAITTGGSAKTLGELILDTGFTGSLTLSGALNLNNTGGHNGNLTVNVGTFDAGNSPVTIDNDFLCGGGTLDIGSDEWVCRGDWDSAGVTAMVTSASGSVELAGTSKNFVHTNTGSNFFIDILISGSYTLTADSILGTDLAITGSLAGANTLTLRSNCSVSDISGSITVTMLTIVSDHHTNAATGLLVAGFYGAATTQFQDSSSADRIVGLSPGTTTFKNLVIITNNASGAYTWDNATNNPNIVCEGGMTLIETAGTITYDRGSGILTFSGVGSGTQPLDFLGKSVEAIVINDTGATKEIQSDFTTAALTLTAGTLADGGNTISVEGNISLAAVAITTMTGVLKQIGSSGAITIATNGNTIGGLTIDNDGVDSCTLQGNLDANGSIVLTDGKLNQNNKTINVGGSWTKAAACVLTNIALVTFDQGAGNFTLTSDGMTFEDVDINNGSVTTFKLQDDMIVNGDLDMIAGKLDLNGFCLTVNGAVTKAAGFTLDFNGGKIVASIIDVPVAPNSQVFRLSGFIIHADPVVGAITVREDSTGDVLFKGRAPGNESFPVMFKDPIYLKGLHVTYTEGLSSNAFEVIKA